MIMNASSFGKPWRKKLQSKFETVPTNQKDLKLEMFTKSKSLARRHLLHNIPDLLRKLPKPCRATITKTIQSKISMLLGGTETNHGENKSNINWVFVRRKEIEVSMDRDNENKHINYTPEMDSILRKARHLKLTKYLLACINEHQWQTLYVLRSLKCKKNLSCPEKKQILWIPSKATEISKFPLVVSIDLWVAKLESDSV